MQVIIQAQIRSGMLQIVPDLLHMTDYIQYRAERYTLSPNVYEVLWRDTDAQLPVWDIAVFVPTVDSTFRISGTSTQLIKSGFPLMFSTFKYNDNNITIVEAMTTFSNGYIYAFIGKV